MSQEKLHVTGRIPPLRQGVSVTEGFFPVKEIIFLVDFLGWPIGPACTLLRILIPLHGEG